MKQKSNKWSIQISGDFADVLKEYCDKNGYTMSGFLEKLIKEKVMNKFVDIIDAQHLRYEKRKKGWEDYIEQKAEDKYAVYSFLKFFKESVNDIGINGKCHVVDKDFSKMKDYKMIITILKDMGFNPQYDEKTDVLRVEW